MCQLLNSNGFTQANVWHFIYKLFSSIFNEKKNYLFNTSKILLISVFFWIFRWIEGKLANAQPRPLRWKALQQ